MTTRLLFPAVALFLAVIASATRAEPRGLRTENFDSDPQWEAHRNRLVPDKKKVVRQDFGHRASNFAGGKKPGEIGGWVQRSFAPAWYGKAISPKSLNDKLTGSGKLAVTRDLGGSGTLLGWFNAKSRGWRTPNSLAFRVDGNGGKYWLFFEYGTRDWRAGGKGCFDGPAYQTTRTEPFKADGTVHEWSFVYDPDGGGGNGMITFTFDGKPYTLTLDPGHKADGATFDRFGIFNQQITGDGMEVYFDDLVVNGEPETFDADPDWQALGNKAEYENRVLRPCHDFGYAKSKLAGGKDGEIGGLIWRDEAPAFYGDRVGPFSLEDELFASGKIAFTGAGSDSAAYVGFFDAATKQKHDVPEDRRPQRNILGILVEGPSRVGHYFRPGYKTADGEGSFAETGPVIRPDGQVHPWSLHYDPNGAEGLGRLKAKFNKNVQIIDLRPGDKKRGGRFDRFGFVNVQSGGSFVYLYLDDLEYSAEKSRRERVEK